MTMSSRTMSGRTSSALVSASSPPLAVTTRKPSSPRASETSFVMRGSSSATSTSGWVLKACISWVMCTHGAPLDLAATLQSTRWRARDHRVLQGRSCSPRTPTTRRPPRRNPTATSARPQPPSGWATLRPVCISTNSSTSCPTSTPTRPTNGWPRSTRSSPRKARSAAGSWSTSSSSGRASSRSGSRRSPRPATSTPSARSRSPTSPATRRWSSASGGSSAGTRWRWSSARTTASPGIGGHLSTYASSASLYETGFNHFFRGKDGDKAGDQIFYQGHAAPGIYARAFLEGRLTEDQLDHFRRETVPGAGPQLVPASAAHAGLLGVPDRLDGPRADQRDLPGAVQPLPAQPRPGRHVRVARLGVPRRRRDRRARVARRAPRRRPRGPRQPDLRRQLQPAAPRRPGPRQRQDHPGARGGLPRLRLERHQGHLGARVGRPPGPRRRRPARPADERDPRRRVPEVLGRRRRVHPRALLRAGPAARQARRAPLRRRPRQAPPRRPRLPQGLRGVQGGDRAQGRPDGHPRQDGQGLDARRRASRPATSPTRPRSCPRTSSASSATGSSCRSPTTSSRTPRTTTRGPRAPRSST